MNAEIGEDEDEDGNFDSLKEGGENGQEGATKTTRSRNSLVDKKTSDDDKKLTLEGENEEDINKTVELDEKVEVKQEPTYDYTAIDELLAFFDQEQLEPILCGYFNKIFQALLTKSKGKIL